MKNTRLDLRLLLLAVVACLPSVAAAQVPTTPPLPEAAPIEPTVEYEIAQVWSRRPVLRVGQDYALKAGEAIRELTVVSGNARIEGEVLGDMVVVLGRVQLSSTAIVGGDLIVVGGSVAAMSGAQVQDDLIVVGGALDAPSEFSPRGQHVVIGPEALGGRLEAIVPWLTRGLLWGRPLVPDLPWVWGIVGLFFLVYLALNLVFDRPVRACAEMLAAKPLTAFLIGLLVLILAGPVLLLLTVTIVGVPFALCALLLAWILGKVGVARWIGMTVVPEERRAISASLRSFVIGFAVIGVAYMIPVLGLVAWTTVGVLGLGGATLAFVSGYRRENPAPAPRMPSSANTEPPPMPYTSNVPSLDSLSPQPEPPDQPSPPVVASAPPSPPLDHMVQTPASDLAAFPHASFRDRFAAFVLDVLLVLIAVQMLALDTGGGERRTLFLLLAYHVGFWAWKGTTVGGIICQLRVIRVDGGPLRFVDALVRGLSSIFSIAVLGIGGLWILKDPERQAWHDKIAGTYVVKVPRHWPL